MTKPQGQKVNMSPDEVYATIWKIEQEHGKTRWTVTTFFISISFAIFGFTFRADAIANPLAGHIQRIAALLLYWFATVLFWQFQRYTDILRSKLIEMEEVGGLSFDIQRFAKERMYGGTWSWLQANRLLAGFGIIYLIGVIGLFLAT